VVSYGDVVAAPRPARGLIDPLADVARAAAAVGTQAAPVGKALGQAVDAAAERRLEAVLRADRCAVLPTAEEMIDERHRRPVTDGTGGCGDAQTA
jgi:hypothetical protein